MADENQDIASPAPAEDEGITAYHGSPYEFERFDTSKIGTGSGAQAYGHGIYLAKYEPIAKKYRDSISEGMYKSGDKIFDSSELEHLNIRVAAREDLNKALERANSLLNEQPQNEIMILNDIDKINEAIASGAKKIAGNMYEVKINANPDHFLDWDKKFSNQSEYVKDAIMKSGIYNEYRKNLSNFNWPSDTRNKNMKGENLHSFLMEKLGRAFPEKTSDYLASIGIKGIKYRDDFHRYKGKIAQNYVVFDDKLLDIKRRYEMGGAVPMASGGEAGDTQSMPQLTSEQQSLLDQLSRAIDRVYPAMDEAEARQPVIRHEPTMPGEPALTREQHQEYNIGQLQNALARVPTDYPTGPVGYAEGGDVGDNPAVQKALSLTAGQNQPVLRSTFALENRPSAIVSPRPGKGGGPPITHAEENFDPSLVTEREPWTYATPDIIGASKPPPVQHPVLNEPRMKNITMRTAKIFKDKNFHKLVKNITGLDGISATPTVGTWQNEMEPSFIISHPEMTPDHAKALAHLLGFGFQQDAAVHTIHNDSLENGIPALLIGNGSKLTSGDINKIAKHSKDHGLDFTVTADGKAAKYLHFGGEESHDDFVNKVSQIADASGMNEKYHAKTQGDLINAKDYLNGIFGSVGGEEGVQASPQRSPDLFRRIVDHVLAPYAKAVASEGYRLSPERLQEAYGLTDDEADYVRSAMRPSGRVDRTTIPLMTKEEKLDIRPTGSRGNPTVEDVLWALQNRAAAKGQIDPGDYSKDAMKKIASDIAKEVDYHVKSSNLGGQKSAIGWYDSALKSAMNVYSSQFPQLAKNKNDRMLFHAILGITSQGNDVYSNSLNAVRVFDLMKNKGLSLADAVRKLSGTFGDKTKAIEMNLLKFDHLINKNGYDAMRDFFNKKATASEINKILRTDKNLYGPSGSPLDVEGQKDQIVSGWSVFGPKIGSFINNLHGDYSTLTADLWFSRTWNRLLGHGFIHTPLTEAKQYRDLRDAMIAEYTHHNGLPHEQVPYVKNGKIDPNESWLHGSDLKNISHDDFHDLINDPDRMLEFAKNAFESYKGGSFKEKSDVRRRAKNWIENRELPVAAPRSDLERSFQQNTAEEAKKILKKKYGVDISVADIQAALWFHEKELFDRLGVASKKSKPADYADAAKQTMDLINSGRLYEVKSREKKSQKASGGSVVDQALRLVSKYGSLPGDAVSLSRHLIQRGRP